MIDGGIQSGSGRTPRRERGLWVLACLGLVVLIGGVHGRSVTHGLFLDDHAHYKQLRECTWSLGGLTDACRLDLVGPDGYIDLWWLPTVTLRFFRPVAFGFMKLAYTAVGWDAAAMHVVSLLWHSLNCLLLMVLLRRLGAAVPVAFGTTAMFAIHPGNVAPVQWIACQTELIVTAFLLGATLCHARWRGWWAAAPPASPASDARPRHWLGIVSVLLFAAALGCRENAILLPVVLLVGDLMQRRERHARFWLAFAPYAAVALAYLVLRTHVLGGAALPPKPYVIPPGDPDFLRFVFDKACYYLIGLVFLVPSVPFGGVPYFRDHASVFYTMSAVAAGLLLLAVVLDRRRLGGWLGAAWLVLFLGPVLPAFEAPHHLYLPGIGWAVLAMILFRAALGANGWFSGWTAFARRTLVWTGGIGLGIAFGVASVFAGMALHAAQLVEDRVADEIASAPRPVRDGDTVYIANLPCIAHYVKLAVEQKTGVRGLRMIGLTWSPRLLGNATGSELTVIDANTIELRIADDRYFDGPFGELARAATGRFPAVAPGAPVVRDDFRVECIALDADGIAGVRCTFRSPLAREGVHLFWGSRTRWARQTPIEELRRAATVTPDTAAAP